MIFRYGSKKPYDWIKTFYHSLDESHKGVVIFNDSSSIRYEVKGEV